MGHAQHLLAHLGPGEFLQFASAQRLHHGDIGRVVLNLPEKGCQGPSAAGMIACVHCSLLSATGPALVVVILASLPPDRKTPPQDPGSGWLPMVLACILAPFSALPPATGFQARAGRRTRPNLRR